MLHNLSFTHFTPLIVDKEPLQARTRTLGCPNLFMCHFIHMMHTLIHNPLESRTTMRSYLNYLPLDSFIFHMPRPLCVLYERKTQSLNPKLVPQIHHKYTCMHQMYILYSACLCTFRVYIVEVIYKHSCIHHMLMDYMSLRPTMMIAS